MAIAGMLFVSILLAPNSYLQVLRDTPSIQGLCSHAQRLLNQRKYVEAREIASKALKIDAQSAEALSLLGESEFALGDFNAAEQHLTEALKIDPALAEAHRALGATFIKQRKFESADAQFEAVLKAAPDDLSCLYGLGFSLLARNKPSNALEPLVRAYHLNPSDAGVLNGLLEVYLKLGQRSQAASVLAELNRQVENDYPQQMQLAEVLVREGAYDLAVNQFQRLLKARPGSYELNYDLALAYHRAGKDDRAAEQIHTMLAQRDEAELENLLGEVEEKRSNYTQALAAYKKATELQPKSEEYRLDYATELVLHWDPTVALRAFIAGVKTFPSSATLWMGLGGCYYLLGKYSEASETLLHASQMAPDNPNVYALLGLAYDAAGPFQKAIAQRFDDYVKAHAGDALSHYFYGKILLDRTRGELQHNFDDAQQQLEKAIALNPSLPQARLEMGKLLLMRRDMPAAKAEFEAAVRLDPESADAYYQLMGIYQKLGEQQEAGQALQKFRELKGKSQNDANRGRVRAVLGGARQ
ncbi:MAG: tetratricopeptide repeat protein [Acidobacteria bacterium]|nr:MAG: tetratricopeptide repeat protein [Acidobacteriota bacterium]